MLRISLHTSSRPWMLEELAVDNVTGFVLLRTSLVLIEPLPILLFVFVMFQCNLFWCSPCTLPSLSTFHGDAFAHPLLTDLLFIVPLTIGGHQWTLYLAK
jgi:hypothetical protein